MDPSRTLVPGKQSELCRRLSEGPAVCSAAVGTEGGFSEKLILALGLVTGIFRQERTQKTATPRK